MTAFTVALGALGPGIASMSEARLTERGVLPLCDFPGALVLLPTMFWGISFGEHLAHVLVWLVDKWNWLVGRIVGSSGTPWPYQPSPALAQPDQTVALAGWEQHH